MRNPTFVVLVVFHAIVWVLIAMALGTTAASCFGSGTLMGALVAWAAYR